MVNEELIKKIIQKKEFSELPLRDVEKIFEKFNKSSYLDEEKIKLTRDLLRKVYSVYTSRKLFSFKNKDEEWFLKKHLSTKERFPYYLEIYSRILKNTSRKLTILDLGSGVNGFSYLFFKKIGKDVKYIGIEAIKQIVEVQNNYFKNKKYNAQVIHKSLFDLNKIQDILKIENPPRIVLLFKVLDSLEMVERDYSKRLLNKISEFSELIVVSFATKSLISKKPFKIKRYWFYDFLKDKFKILDEFEKGNEKYLILSKK